MLSAPCWLWWAAVVTLLLLGFVSSAVGRRMLLLTLFVLHASALFLGVSRPGVRLLGQPTVYEDYRDVLEFLKGDLGFNRVHISTRFLLLPGLTAKQGMMKRLQVVNDYEPLMPARYAEFLAAVTPPSDTFHPFAGAYELRPTSRWPLLDLMGTKYFAMVIGEPAEVFMASHPGAFISRYTHWPSRLYERPNALPRSFVVTRARSFRTGNEVLAALQSGSFDPREEVLLEDAVLESDQAPANASAPGSAEILSYDPEHVVVDANVQYAAYLVLTDLFYPGWTAYIGDHQTPMYRADYLFRAVRLEPGRSRVRFVYTPASLRAGFTVSGVALAVLGMVAITSKHRSAH